jgi:hypothetical protein
MPKTTVSLWGGVIIMDYTELMEAACNFFEGLLTENHREFLLKRYGFTPETIAIHRLGYANDDACDIAAYLYDQCGFSADLIRGSGLYDVSNKQFRFIWPERYIFPYLVQGKPMFFVGRATDATPRHPDKEPAKYKKQMVFQNGPQEPIFGIDSIVDGQPMIITEGVADCISAHQVGYAAISPVTIQFKTKVASAVAAICKRTSKVYLINDSEDNNAGLHGAVKVGRELCKHGIFPSLVEIPREKRFEKVDLNDYIRNGGDIQQLLESALDVEAHPLFKESQKKEWEHAAGELKSAVKKVSYKSNGRKIPYNALNEEVINALPSLREIVGFTGMGVHPIYGSKTGQNLKVEDDLWYCFHKGHEGGGDALKWVAVYDMGIIREDEKLRGDNFLAAIEYARKKCMNTRILGGGRRSTLF